ncbi:MAG: hypothetical protein ABIN01_17460 [Ferruginibacter sp.]
MIKNNSLTNTHQPVNALMMKMITRRRNMLAAFFVVCLFHTNAQVAVNVAIEKQFDNYRKTNLQEKIFVHTDKNMYVPGEICWFKIYNVDACFHKPIDLGKVAYVEVLDKNNNPVLQAKIALEKGTGDGSLYLPATLVSGNYRLRAYTNWMKNFGAGYFFEKKITIINVQKDQPVFTAAVLPAYDIAFFPEGGNLVNGIQSKVGFRVVNSAGKGVHCEGSVLNEKEEVITKFSPLQFGIGSFTFRPVQGSKYKAIVKLPGGEQRVQELPAAYDNGYAMQLDHVKGQLKVTVRTPDNTTSAAIYLFVHTRNVVKAVMSSAFKNGIAEFIIDEAKTGDGISHFTVFNEQRQPVCERLFFKKPIRGLQINAAADAQVYGLRKKINVGINTATEAGNSIAANMSMAVYRLDSLTGIDESDINNYLALTADLLGSVESPAYYFTDKSETALIALDNLVLTQGWRRFRWDDILSDKQAAFRFLPELNGHIINGKITALQPGLPLDGVSAYLSVPGTPTQFQISMADKKGTVKFELKNFYSSADIIAQTNTEYDSLYKVDIEQPFSTDYSQKQLAPVNLTIENAALLKMYIASQVQNSFSYTKLNQSTLPLPDTTAFYLRPDVTYLLDNYVRFTTLEEVLREYVLEVGVRPRGGKFHLPVYDALDKTLFSEDPLVLLDGVAIFDLKKLMKYDPLKIRKLEVVTRPYFLGTSVFYGIVNFTTYTGDIEGFEIDPRATIVDYEGLQLQRDFYSPVYETATQSLSRIPDFRNLLYWSPTITTTNNGKEQAAFYSADIPGRYAIVVQGISDDGRAGSGISYFEVKK